MRRHCPSRFGQTLMIRADESESKPELDRFVDAMLPFAGKSAGWKKGAWEWPRIILHNADTLAEHHVTGSVGYSTSEAYFAALGPRRTSFLAASIGSTRLWRRQTCSAPARRSKLRRVMVRQAPARA